MAEKATGSASRVGLVMGEVVDRMSDPTQTGMVKVRWNMGQINQSDLSEKDLPYSKSLMSRHSASIRGIGGPHTGYIGSNEGKGGGSKVYGMSISGDGQDMIILGSVPSAGKGDPDGQPQYDSDIPQPGKVEKNGTGESQPKYGDKNGVAEDYKDESVIKYAEEKAGPEKSPAKYKDLDDSAGTVGSSEGPEGQSKNDLIEA